MKKSLVALATLAVAGVASAQPSVTLFGVVDVGVSSYSNKSDSSNFFLPPLLVRRQHQGQAHRAEHRRPTPAVSASVARKTWAAAWLPASGSRRRSPPTTARRALRASPAAQP